jgi:hypothetical protein
MRLLKQYKSLWSQIVVSVLFSHATTFVLKRSVHYTQFGFLESVEKTCLLHRVCHFWIARILIMGYHLDDVKLQDGYFQSRPEAVLTRIRLVGVISCFPFFCSEIFFSTQTVFSSTQSRNGLMFLFQGCLLTGHSYWRWSGPEGALRFPEGFYSFFSWFMNTIEMARKT